MPYTSNFLTVNGLALSLTEVSRESEDLDEWGRGGGLTYEGTTYGQKAMWKFDTAPLLPTEADSLAGWLKGAGLYWNFDLVDGATTRFTAYSTESGMGWFPVTTGYTASSDAKFGRWGMMLLPSAAVAVTATFGIERPGLSASGWKKTGAGAWELCSASYDGGTTRYFVGTAVTTAFAWLAFTKTTNYLAVRLDGESGSGSSSTTLYDGWMILPYSLATNQLSARLNRTEAEPGFPYVGVGGKHPRTDSEFICKGFVEERTPVRVSIDGTYYPHAETLSGSLVEK